MGVTVYVFSVRPPWLISQHDANKSPRREAAKPRDNVWCVPVFDVSSGAVHTRVGRAPTPKSDASLHMIHRASSPLPCVVQGRLHPPTAGSQEPAHRSVGWPAGPG